MATRVKDQITSQFMVRALELAIRGRGRVEPNPMVGCVIERDGRIIAEGYHEKYGGPHAEEVALSRCQDPGGARMFITLEPCSHTGKRPPCTKAVIDAGITEVHIATLDPFLMVSGRGVKELEQAGIQCLVGVNAEDAKRLNAPYFKRVIRGMPYVTLKWAMTLDGKIATRTGESKWISGEKARERVHVMRNRVDAVVVGIGTVLADDPLLTCRVEGGRNPRRCIIDPLAQLSLDSHIVKTAKEVPTFLVVGKTAAAARLDKLQETGITLLKMQLKDGHVDLEGLLRYLAQKEFTNVLVEGGGNIAASMLTEKLVDKVVVFIAPKVVGGRDAITPVEGEGIEKIADALEIDDLKIGIVGQDIMIEGFPR
ncbi:MAG: bifunctional diaminohydroxyphosphoribosylaminopyrimidine deaminase/5-amino-6-(5-phosphoribosylamino)uracil reductase RibD [Planctomycetota bacterium]|nr:MAG: bifunctional diaminohydroxyphosphoribosylaminopyrimidine deaminase/5-amino-6-(5-phosphoribosylamino)uracil reductase RibD [Planctomycetota bacterium]